MAKHLSKEELLTLLSEARCYVFDFYPQTEEQQQAQEGLLNRIDAVMPLIDLNFKVCDEPGCCLRAGHQGAHDDMPF